MVSRVKNVADLERGDSTFIQGESPRSNISPRLNVNDLLKRKEKVAEVILPDLNLKTETVLNLFKDVDYDLNTVRNEIDTVALQNYSYLENKFLITDTKLTLPKFEKKNINRWKINKK